MRKLTAKRVLRYSAPLTISEASVASVAQERREDLGVERARQRVHDPRADLGMGEAQRIGGPGLRCGDEFCDDQERPEPARHAANLRSSGGAGAIN